MRIVSAASGYIKLSKTSVRVFEMGFPNYFRHVNKSLRKVSKKASRSLEETAKSLFENPASTKIKKRRRGTAIVETSKGILVAAERNGLFLLPGGGADKHESRRQATIRELIEETGLAAYSVKYLFSHVGRTHKFCGGGGVQDHHKVFLVKVHGSPKPRHEIKQIKYYKPGDKIRLSRCTKEIIKKYLSSHR